MPEVGDRVRVESRKLGQVVREGVVTGVVGHLLRIEWDGGEESTFMPGPGAVTVIGRVRAAAPKKIPAKKTTAKKTTAKKAPLKKIPAKKTR